MISNGMQQSVWKEAQPIFKTNFSVLFVIAVVDCLVELSLGWSDETWLVLAWATMGIFTSTIVAYIGHVSALNGSSFIPADLIGAAWPNVSFWSATIAVASVVMVGIGAAAALSIQFHNDNLGGTALAFTVLGYFAFLCRLGTIFPAAAIDQDWNLRNAYIRGKGKTLDLFKDLMKGAIAGMMLLLLIAMLFDAVSIENFIWNNNQQVSPVGTIMALLFNVAYSFVTILGVVAFCRAYRRTKEADF